LLERHLLRDDHRSGREKRADENAQGDLGSDEDRERRGGRDGQGREGEPRHGDEKQAPSSDAVDEAAEEDGPERTAGDPAKGSGHSRVIETEVDGVEGGGCAVDGDCVALNGHDGKECDDHSPVRDRRVLESRFGKAS
jgi:hypothetical protein